MYKRILFCLDNSDPSIAGMEIGLCIGRATSAAVTGCHVYAAELHNDRFRRMEEGLPEEYQGEEKLKKQRDTHDTLITKGLKIISGTYTGIFLQKAREAGLAGYAVNREGKNFEEIIKEAVSGGYDLIVMGANGLGGADGASPGSVCERVARRAPCDVLIVRNNADSGGAIVAAVDGSPLSFGALASAMELSSIFKRKVEAVSVYDPDYHRRAFRSIAGVISVEAGKLFRFQEQQRLHDEIIDNGLAKIYASHLETAAAMGRDYGVTVKTSLLAGRPRDEIASFAKNAPPFIIAFGKTGVHATESLDIGSVTEACLRKTSSNVLISARAVTPSAAAQASPSAVWSDEAAGLLLNIPSFARAIVKKMAEDAAEKDGVSPITPEFMRAVRKRMVE